jgi:hypothetical protein
MGRGHHSRTASTFLSVAMEAQGGLSGTVACCGHVRTTNALIQGRRSASRPSTTKDSHISGSNLKTKLGRLLSC